MSKRLEREIQNELDKTLLQMAREQNCEPEDLAPHVVEATKEEITASWNIAYDNHLTENRENSE